MKVYSTPVPAPEFEESMVDGRYSHEKDDEVTERYIAQVKTWLTDHGYHHKLTGEVVRFPIADGYAQYMVANATTLIWLPLGDAWQIPDAHARGLRISDIKAEIDRARKFRELFSAKAAS